MNPFRKLVKLLNEGFSAEVLESLMIKDLSSAEQWASWSDTGMDSRIVSVVKES